MLVPVASQSESSSSELAPLRVCSINHRTHGLSGLASLGGNSGPAARLQSSLSAHGIDVVILTTCNRFELYWRSRTSEDDSIATTSVATALGLGPHALKAESSWKIGDAAASHLFRVCAGLESVVMGEAEILGQVRGALDANPGAGTFLTGVFRAAIRAGRAARAETAIGDGALSVASTAVRWLSTQMPLGERRVLVIGAGDTARKVARHLNAIGVGALIIANRTRDRAEAISSPLGADAIGLDALPEELGKADAVISAVNASEWIVTVEHLRQRTQQRPLVVIDLSMPPSIEPGEVRGIARIDLAVLEQAAQANRRQREREVPAVEAVIARELNWLRRWARREALRPSIARQES
ncbi:MAG: glutamyl-tRNA reductase [Vicinamibacterales bacterium]